MSEIRSKFIGKYLKNKRSTGFIFKTLEVDRKIEDDYHQIPRRLYFDLFKPLVYERDIRRSVVLMGPRGVGKTVMLYHMVQDMIENGVDPMKIIFITIENPIYNNTTLELLFSYAKEAIGIDDKGIGISFSMKFNIVDTRKSI